MKKIVYLSLIASMLFGSASLFAESKMINSNQSIDTSSLQVMELVAPRVTSYHYGSEVTMEFTVHADGSVSDIKRGKVNFDRARIEVATKMTRALENWRFSPALDTSGNAIPVRVQMPVVVTSRGISMGDYDVINVATLDAEAVPSIVEG
ncbi:MAG: energy transducer TonB [Puniceicoccaceae bacterium]